MYELELYTSSKSATSPCKPRRPCLCEWREWWTTSRFSQDGNPNRTNWIGSLPGTGMLRKGKAGKFNPRAYEALSSLRLAGTSAKNSSDS